MFNENILKSIKDRKTVVGYTDPNWNYDMYDFIYYMNSHPNEFKIWEPRNRRLGLTGMEQRSSTPDFAKNIIKILRTTFYKNQISCYSFCGFTEYSKSFQIHKDTMDVLYLQVIGDTEWSIWESDLDEKQITADQGTCVFKEKFTPGKWIWVPRGTYHFVQPITPRVGVSFGIENDLDPASYLNV
jgi:hypothetical protein